MPQAPLIPPSPIGADFRFCFTLDTEPDNLWANRPTLSFDHFARLAEFHRALIDRGARPTYLTTSEVADDASAARVMGAILETGRAEIGAHFHSWTRQWPFPIPDLGTPPLHAMAHQLGQALEEQMLAFTCDRLTNAFGVRPSSYRGGRWSLNDRSVLSLLRCGIRVDSTVTPGMSWQDERHPLLSGPDFCQSPRHPFYLQTPEPGPALGPSRVLELPVGAASLKTPRLLPERGLPGKIVRKVMGSVGRPIGQVWLRPTLMNRAQMQACLRSLREDGVPVWVAMIHSSEIVPCAYFPTEAAVGQFRERCLQLVDDAMAQGARGATLQEVLEQYEKAA